MKAAILLILAALLACKQAGPENATPSAPTGMQPGECFNGTACPIGEQCVKRGYDTAGVCMRLGG